MELLHPIWEIGKCLCLPLKHHINYIESFQETFEKLNQEAQDLYARRVDVDREIESNRVLKVPTSECKAWIKRVDDIKILVNGIEVEFNGNKKCLCEWFPNIWWRVKLGKRVMTMIDDISKLKEESRFEGGIIVVAPPRIVEPTPTLTIEGNTSSAHTIQKILGCLKDEKIGSIGVWGMGGVGKTTIVKNLYNLPEILQMFRIVIWVTVSKDWSVRKVQQNIAHRLSLSLEENESDDSVASKLFQKLRIMKFLLLLDDVWDRVDLDAVGVPNTARENGCKIVLTGRYLNVCQQMETAIDIKVEVLSEIEAWDLFHEKVGDVVNSSNIESLAKEVVKECGGLPLVLIMIGRSLRKVSEVRVWSNALTELKKATFQIDENMEKLVFMRLKFSYDRLKDDNIKNCFLYCTLFPEDFKIPVPELIEHWWIEGFIDGKLNFGEAYDKGYAILNDLTNASLLERIEDYRHRLVAVKMHDVIRDMALRITSPEGEGFCRYMVKAGARITAMSSDEDWVQADKISLMDNKLGFLPRRPECTWLTTLLLQKNRRLKEIPDSFFEHMHSLRVLNLSDTSITELPSSFLNLASLQGLYLCSCDNLHTLPSGVGNLTTLEVLHLGPRIHYLTIEVGQLTRLRSLRVEFSNKRSVTFTTHIIPEGLLSRLTLLEDLRVCMDGGILRSWFTNYTKAVVEELLSLKRLTSLRFHFPKVKYLEYFLQGSFHWNEQCSKSFRFAVGISYLNEYVSDRYLGWSEDDAISSIAIREVLKRSSAFGLQVNKSCKKLSDFCSMEMMNGLESCQVQWCDAIESVIDGNGLPNLEELHLWELPKLRTIWERSVPPQSVTFLRDLNIWDCPKLSNIFSLGMIQHLSNLQVLDVYRCPEVVEIVNEEDMAMVVNSDDMVVVLFPRLKELTLGDLPKLVRICKQVQNPIAWPSLEVIDIEGCPDLKNFPLSSSRAPALFRASAEAVDWNMKMMPLNKSSIVSVDARRICIILLLSFYLFSCLI